MSTLLSREDLLAVGRFLPLEIVLEVPIQGFTVRSLLQLRPGDVLQSGAQHNEDMMVHVNGQLLGMAKFDVSGDVLAVRLTEVL
jgi:flagellar motor switch/type III secretory pathway protein FliN